MSLAHCDGEITTAMDGAAICSGEWLAYGAGVLPDDFDVAVAGELFFYGFTLVGAVILFSVGVRVVLSQVKRG